MQVFNYQSLIGNLKLVSDGDYLTEIRFSAGESAGLPGHPVLDRVVAQLDAYFSGELQEFDLPLRPDGTRFQQQVWDQLVKIPYGATLTYLELARRLGDEKVIRAAARANGQNPIPIVIPCHRVIGADGRLTGYAGGVERKRWLLQHEGALLL